MKLSTQRFFVFMVISFLLSPAAILSADRALLGELSLEAESRLAAYCCSQAIEDKDFFTKNPQLEQLAVCNFIKILRGRQATQAIQRSVLDEEIATIERRQRQENEARKEEVLRQRAALLATVDVEISRKMPTGWVSKPGNLSWR